MNYFQDSAPSIIPLPFHYYVPKSNHPDMGLLQQEAIKLAGKIRQVQRPPAPALKIFKKKLKSYKTTAINWFENRKRTKEGRDDLLPLFFLWSVTRNCNFYCDYCCDHRGNKYPDLDNSGVLSTEKALNLLEIMRTRAPSVYYAGGEPTSRADLPKIMRRANELNYFPQIINSNGSLLSKLLLKEEWNSFLADIDILIISLDGLDVNELNKTYHYNKSLDILRLILALRELRGQYKFKLMVNCVVRPGKIADAIDVLNWANDLGITFTGVPVNEGPAVKKGLFNDSEYARFVDLLLERHKKKNKFAGSFRMNQRLYTGAPLDCRNTLKPHIDYDGRLFWPCKACVNVPPAMVNVLEYKNVDEVWAAGRKLISPDNFHGPAKNQCGANCNWAQNYSTDTYYHGIKNPGSMLKDIRDFLN